MYNSDTEVLFPWRAVPSLKGIRGMEWDQLIDTVLSETVEDVDRQSFILMVVRIFGCTGCNSDSFRAMRGCAKCAQQSIRRYRGEDADLVKLFEKTKQEIKNYRKANAPDK
jgi:hypothetical protein